MEFSHTLRSWRSLPVSLSKHFGFHIWVFNPWEFNFGFLFTVGEARLYCRNKPEFQRLNSKFMSHLYCCPLRVYRVSAHRSPWGTWAVGGLSRQGPLGSLKKGGECGKSRTRLEGDNVCLLITFQWPSHVTMFSFRGCREMQPLPGPRR